MSLGVVIKGPEGIVLAADSRVTLTAQLPGENVLLPATYDNATKLLRVAGQDFVGVVTYGQGAMGQPQPRTAHSFMPEFEGELRPHGRLSVEEFSAKLSNFFVRQWQVNMPADYPGPDMVFLIGGYDEGAAYGRVFEFRIPSSPQPREWHGNDFGIVWGGQREFVDRLFTGFDESLLDLAKGSLSLSETQTQELRQHLRTHLSLRIPYAFLPLQDCVDLAIFMIRTTMAIQSWWIGIRGVGGAIDVATVSRIEGFRPVQQKSILGERR